MNDMHKRRILAILWPVALPVVNAYLTMWTIVLLHSVYSWSLSRWDIYAVVFSPLAFYVIWEEVLRYSNLGKAYILAYLLLALLPLLASCTVWMLRPCRKTFFITLLTAFALYGPIAMRVMR